MAFIIPRQPTMLESLGQGLQLGLPGLIAGGQRQMRQEDLALLASVLGQQGQQGQPQIGGAIPQQGQIGGQGGLASILGQLQSPFGQQMGMGLLQQQFQSPLEQAQAEYYKARAQAELRPPVVKAERGIRQIREEPIGSGEFKVAIIDPTTGETIRELGKPTPREIVGEVAPEALSKPVKVKLENEIAAVNKSILESETVLSLWKPEFSTLGAQLEAWWTRKRERAKGIPIVGKIVGTLFPVTAADKRALTAYSSWRGAAGKKFFAFRKWVTGVAGGQLEMDQIRQVFPDEKTKSPTEFSAMYDQMIAFEKAYRRQLIEAIRRGTIITDKVKADIMVDVFSTQSQLQSTGQPVGIPTTGRILPAPKLPTGFLGRKESEFPEGFKPDNIRTMTDEELKRIMGIE